jgi:hypothetical protein
MSEQQTNQTLYTEESLRISGYGGAQVANTFFRQIASTKHLAVILPGAGYSARMPILYYTVSLFLEHGADILTVDYDYRTPAIRQNPNFKDRLTQNVAAAIRFALAERSYEQVTLIGKSLGTRAMSWLLAQDELDLNSAFKFKTVWLTPLWSDPEAFSLMKSVSGQALHIIGTADQAYYNEGCKGQLMELKNTTVLTIKDADHSLDIDGDIKASLDAVYSMISGIEKFVFGI